MLQYHHAVLLYIHMLLRFSNVVGRWGPRRRAGDVIPQVLGLAPSLCGSAGVKGKPFVFPTACPACGTEVVKEEVGGRKEVGGRLFVASPVMGGGFVEAPRSGDSRRPFRSVLEVLSRSNSRRRSWCGGDGGVVNPTLGKAKVLEDGHSDHGAGVTQQCNRGDAEGELLTLLCFVFALVAPRPHEHPMYNLSTLSFYCLP